MPAIRIRREFGWLAALLVVIQPLGLIQDKPAMAAVGRAPGYLEREITFPNEGSSGPATLCLPTSREKKLAVVVLVRAVGPEQGSSDHRAAFMFADLAHGLARSGLASLRYDPQPFSFSKAPGPNQLPLDQQIVNQGVAALAYVSGLPEIDPSVVFVLGHGLAGTVAPYIAARYGRVRGLILMAAPGLPVEKTLAQQKRIELQKQGMSPQEIEDIVTAQNQTFADIRSGKMQPSRLYAGATVAYWRDRMNRDPARKARSLDIPILVLQGANDTEVHETDYDRLQLALGRKASGMAQFHWFPDLNHVFMSSKDVQSSSSQPSNVHPEVIRVIASWIESQARSASPKK
jgi:pimeloyl-ACP methyl ester carboxylesterase